MKLSPATVSRILRRLGLNRMRDLESAEPVRRYEHAHPGDMIHLDIKKLGRFDRVGHRITGDRKGQSSARGIGWEFVHVCIDDASRLAFSQTMPDEKAVSAVAFLKAAVAYHETRAAWDYASALLVSARLAGICGADHDALADYADAARDRWHRADSRARREEDRHRVSSTLVALDFGPEDFGADDEFDFSAMTQAAR